VEILNSGIKVNKGHKLSKKLVDENQVISMEDLQIKIMVRNRKLAKAISASIILL